MSITAVCRLLTRHLRPADALPPAPEFWAGTRLLLPAGNTPSVLEQVLTGTVVPIGGEVQDVAELFETFPVSVLVPRGAE